MRTCISAALSLIMVHNNIQYSLDISIYIKLFLLLMNFTYGYLIGFVLGFPIWIVEACGRIIDMQRGDQMGAIISKMTNNPSSTLSKFFVLAFTAYFAANSGIVYFFGIIFESFITVPINKSFPLVMKPDSNAFIGLLSDYFYLVVILVAPIIFILLIVDVAFSIIGAFVPQLNITIISMPIKSILALFLISIYLGLLFHDVFNKFVVKLPNFF